MYVCISESTSKAVFSICAFSGSSSTESDKVLRNSARSEVEMSNWLEFRGSIDCWNWKINYTELCVCVWLKVKWRWRRDLLWMKRRKLEFDRGESPAECWDFPVRLTWLKIQGLDENLSRLAYITYTRVYVLAGIWFLVLIAFVYTRGWVRFLCKIGNEMGSLRNFEIWKFHLPKRKLKIVFLFKKLIN